MRAPSYSAQHAGHSDGLIISLVGVHHKVHQISRNSPSSFPLLMWTHCYGVSVECYAMHLEGSLGWSAHKIVRQICGVLDCFLEAVVLHISIGRTFGANDIHRNKEAIWHYV